MTYVNDYFVAGEYKSSATVQVNSPWFGGMGDERWIDIQGTKIGKDIYT